MRSLIHLDSRLTCLKPQRYIARNRIPPLQTTTTNAEKILKSDKDIFNIVIVIV